MFVSDLPTRIAITDEGPREGFQIEKECIPSADKVRLIDALSETGLKAIQVCSFVSPRLVPGWADADDVAANFKPTSDINYSALWFNQRGIDRALAQRERLTLTGTIHVVASEAFCVKNLGRGRDENLQQMRSQTKAHLDADITVGKISVMAAFGCNFQGRVDTSEVLAAIRDGHAIASEANFSDAAIGFRGNCSITEIALADTMGWANPALITRTVASVRSQWPDTAIRLHLHDTRGLGIANAYAGMCQGVDRFDTTVGGLGGCPFAAHPGAPGNIATEELVLLAEEMGIATGVDLDALLAAGHLAEKVVGRQLPSALLRAGALPEVTYHV